MTERRLRRKIRRMTIGECQAFIKIPTTDKAQIVHFFTGGNHNVYDESRYYSIIADELNALKISDGRPLILWVGFKRCLVAVDFDQISSSAVADISALAKLGVAHFHEVMARCLKPLRFGLFAQEVKPYEFAAFAEECKKLPIRHAWEISNFFLRSLEELSKAITTYSVTERKMEDLNLQRAKQSTATDTV